MRDAYPPTGRVCKQRYGGCTQWRFLQDMEKRYVTNHFEVSRLNESRRSRLLASATSPGAPELFARHFEGDTLYEFYDEAELRRRKVYKRCAFCEAALPSFARFSYKLPHYYKGTNMVFFNGSLFYQRAGTPKIAKYTLASKRYEEQVVSVDAAHKSEKVRRGV